MRTILVGATVALLVAGCTTQGQPGPYGSSHDYALGNSCGELGWGKVLGAALGGALLGGFAGSNIDKVNCQNAMAARQQALAPATPIGQTITWNDPKSGATGTFTPTREGRSDTGQYCREYTQTIVIDGEQKQGVGRACQQPDGSWKSAS